MAFDYFSKMKVDFAVIETGLGGRLDSTNIIAPEISVITNISLDHTAILGNTLPAIAKEKAGIIKKNTPIVIGEKQGETEAVFRTVATAQNAAISFASDTVSIETKNQLFYLNEVPIPTDLPGLYQAKNIATTLQAITTLRAKGFAISEEKIKVGLANVKTLTNLRGRWETLSHNPLVICDTGHNKAGLTYIIKQLKSLKKRELHLVLGFVDDKDLNAVLPLFPKEATYYFTQPTIARALPKEALGVAAAKHGLKGALYSSGKAALVAAQTKAGKNDVVFIGGSTFLVADVL